MDNNENIKNLAESFWKYYEPKIAEKSASAITYFRAEIVANPGDGTLTVQRPYDETAMNLPCVSSMTEAKVGDQVTVFVFGKNLANNAVVVADGKVSTLGGGNLKIASETVLGGIKIGNGVAIDDTTGVMDTNVWVDDTEPTNARVGDVWIDTTKKGVSFDTIYPIGSIYISVNSTNPKDLFGIGTWEQIQGRFLLGTGTPTANTDSQFGNMSGTAYSAEAKSTGGQDAHTLTTSEIPSHKHDGLYYYQVADNRVLTMNGGSTGYKLTWTYSSGDGEVEIMTGYSGDGNAHNNMPPYFAVYMWYRVA